MDRRILFIGGGAIIVIAVAIILALSLPNRAPEEPIDTARLNTLALANEYLSDGEYQRALDLVDRLLINDTTDLEARALRETIVDAKRAAEELAREESRREQEELKDTIAESIKESAPPPPEPTPEPEPEPEADPEIAAARAAELAAEERRRAEVRQKTLDVERLIGEGIRSMESERYIEARTKFTEALSLDDDIAEAYAQMGEAFFREDAENERNLQKAVEFSSKAVEKDKTYWLPHYTLGKIYESTRSWDNAIDEYSEATRLNPERDDIWYQLGKVQFRAAEFSDAAESFGTATHLNPSNHRAFYNLGVTYERLGGKEDAIAAYGEATDANPEYHLGYYSAGELLNELERFGEAIPLLEKATLLNPRDMRYPRELATAHFFRGNLAAAQLNYRKAFDLASDDARNNYNMAVVMLLSDNAETALAFAARAVEINPEAPAYFFTLGEVSEILGDLDTAILMYERAVKLDGNFLSARINLGKLKDADVPGREP